MKTFRFEVDIIGNIDSQGGIFNFYCISAKKLSKKRLFGPLPSLGELIAEYTLRVMFTIKYNLLLSDF